ncbi:MAG: hypothetical protein HYV26_22060 [Candidatus Hydrogenedentes bacterium]|nr:hypothetical protein [Candidatus Hydrogenedentota bacterium]
MARSGDHTTASGNTIEDAIGPRSMRIPLPVLTQETGERHAHPFPAQIGFQTLELMQASIFHVMLMDEAAGQRVRQADGVQGVDQALIEAGLKKSLLDDGWKYLGKYKGLFERFVFQNVLITLRSQWDWYIRNLGAFVLASTRSEGPDTISSSQQKRLEGIGFKDILNQLAIIEDCAVINFEISESIKLAVREMSLVRNLGLHNRWEVDDYYIEKTATKNWRRREIRQFDMPELEEWHRALVRLVNSTWSPVAVRFKDAPPYTIES